MSIDDALRTLASESGEASIPSEESTLAYLSGTATELEIREVREAALLQPSFRQDLADLGSALESIEDPATVAAFDAVTPGRPPALEPDRAARPVTWHERYLAMLPRPALAFAVAIVLIAAPVAWLLFQGDDSPFVEAEAGALVFTLREAPRLVFRDGGELPPKVLTVDAATEGVVLQLRVPRGARESQTWSVELTDAARHSWRLEALQTQESEGGAALVFTIDPGRLAPGDAEIRAVREDALDRPVIYRFRLEMR